MINIPKRLQEDEFRFIRVTKNDKFPPLENGWQKDNNYKYNDPILLKWLAEDGNYGVVLGFGNLVAIDCDTMEVANKFGNVLKASTLTAKTIRGRHYYFIAEDLKTRKYGEKGEYRGQGSYVMGPNSIRPEGTYDLITDDIISKLNKTSSDNIKTWFGGKKTKQEVVSNISDNIIVDSIIPYWKEGSRQELALGLCGLLRKQGFGIKKVTDIITTICNKTEDEEVDARVNTIKCTFEKDEQDVSGYKTLCDILPEEVIKKITDIEVIKTPETTKESLMLEQKTQKILDSILSAEDLAVKDLPEPKWLVEKLVVDDGVTIFGGKGASLKSLSVLKMAMNLATGTSFLNTFSTIKSKVLLVDEENGLRRIKQRFLQLRHNIAEPIDDLHFVPYPDIKVDVKEGAEILKAIIIEHNPDIIIFDSLLRFTSGEENSASDARTFYDSLKNMSKVLDKPISFIVIHHMTKGNAVSIDSFRGSSDWYNSASVAIGFSRDKEDDDLFHVNTVKVRDGSPKDYPPFDISVTDVDIIKDEENVYPFKHITLNWQEIQNEDEDDEENECRRQLFERIRDDKLTEISTGKDGICQQNNFFGLKLGKFYNLLKKLQDEGIITPLKRGTYKVNMSNFIEDNE